MKLINGIVNLTLLVVLCGTAEAQYIEFFPDTTLNYKTVKYRDGNVREREQFIASKDYNPDIAFEKETSQDGMWRFDYKRNGKLYYFLANYQHNQIIGKQYFFNHKGKLIAVKIQHPVINNIPFDGLQINHYDKKERLKKVEFQTADSLSKTGVYTNEFVFNKQGQLKDYFYYNQAKNEIKTMKYNKKNELVSDLSVNTTQQDYFNRWSWKKNRLISLKREGNQMIKEVYFRKKLIKVKVTRYSF